MLLLLARQRPAWHSQHDGEPGLNWTGLDRGVGPCFILELGKDRGRGVGALPGAEARMGWLIRCNQGAYPAQLQALLRAKGIDAEVTNVSDPVSMGRMD